VRVLLYKVSLLLLWSGEKKEKMIGGGGGGVSVEFLNILNPLGSVGDSACGLAHTNTTSFF